MHLSKLKLLILTVSVVGSGIIVGTFLWLNMPAKHRSGGWQARSLEGLEHYGDVPAFSFMERSGNKLALAQLRGNLWVADFIYTTCTDTCPLQSAEMAKLQARWQSRGDFKLVSFSVDPARDTPGVLAGYADRFHADADRWYFLTGDKTQMTRLVQEGFRLSVSAAAEEGPDSDVILHSSRFVLVDKKAQIRGYYDSRDSDALKRLNDDIATLIKG